MGHTQNKIEQARAQIADTEQRIGRQRRRVEKLLVERNPADEAQAELLIMEQSLIAMTRYLEELVRNFEAGTAGAAKQKAPKNRKCNTRPEEES